MLWGERVMYHRSPEFEVRFMGKNFMSVRDGEMNVQGVDFRTDLANVSRLIGLLSDLLNTALSVRDDAFPGNAEARALHAGSGDNVHLFRPPARQQQNGTLKN